MKLRLALFSFLLCMVVVSVGLMAQDTSTMVGTVQDPTGASIADAHIAVSNTTRGINRTTTTNSAGEWARSRSSARNLQPYRHWPLVSRNMKFAEWSCRWRRRPGWTWPCK